MLGSATLSVGWQTIARDHFKADPPSPLDLENAIAAIEDEIARVHRTVARGPVVVTTDETVRDVALASGLPEGAEMVLPIDPVERLYARLAGPRGLPGNPRFAATLLVLRELMHHLEIDRIVVKVH